MNKQDILNELKKRDINIEEQPSMETPQISKNVILNELRRRGIGQTKSGEFLPTPQKQAEDQGAYGNIIDVMDIPEANTRSQAVEDYLTSKEFGRLALEVTGGVAGAMMAPAIVPAVAIGRVAMMLRPALQGVVTRMAGSGFGEAGGAAVSQTFDPRFDAKDDFIEIAGDVTKDLLRAFGTGVLGEGAGAVINKGISKVVGRNKKLIDGADEAVKTIEAQKNKIIANPKSYSTKVKEAMEVGKLTPGLLQEGQLIDLTENIAEMSLIGGGSIRYAREGAETIAQSGLDDFLKLYEDQGGSEAIGQLFQKTLTKDMDAWKGVANAKYSALDKALSSNNFANKFQVSLVDIKKMARNELGNLGGKRQSSGLKSFLDDIADEPNYVNFKRANILRSNYLETLREFTGETLSGNKKRLATMAEKEITKAMDNAAVPESTKNLLKEANKHYREGIEVFNDDLFKSIIDKDPDLVYKSIVASGDRPELINQTFKLIDKRFKNKAENSLLKNKIRGSFLKDFLTKSQKQNAQFGVEIDGGKLSKFFANKERTFDAMFTPSQIKDFKKFQNALMFSQGRLKKKGGLSGAIMIQMKQSGAVMQLAGAGAAGGAGMGNLAATILLAPAAMARAFTYPPIIKALTLGYKYNENPTLAARYFLQAVTQMNKENLISDDEFVKIKQDIKDSKK
jgi:hypothetical protein|tara:strand:- start:49 stop:2088 length:2040 start_codon:yes stop_codon:yes gene_type:complete